MCSTLLDSARLSARRLLTASLRASVFNESCIIIVTVIVFKID